MLAADCLRTVAGMGVADVWEAVGEGVMDGIRDGLDRE
jgi:hypothetical protein